MTVQFLPQTSGGGTNGGTFVAVGRQAQAFMRLSYDDSEDSLVMRVSERGVQLPAAASTAFSVALGRITAFAFSASTR